MPLATADAAPAVSKCRGEVTDTQHLAAGKYSSRAIRAVALNSGKGCSGESLFLLMRPKQQQQNFVSLAVWSGHDVFAACRWPGCVQPQFGAWQ